ncbi:ATP-binding protein [Paenibacillus xylanexedens]|uniref:AAA family ATPase n=1 Tax=Paenibacillus xylanexedens TaxID=528191 RepID=UPI001F36C1DE|nr:AAA family ATPase [Paenibacillus xylanexedens]MCF7756725.1 ATP-binding protein [Paenibacillus xylanexedens]
MTIRSLEIKNLHGFKNIKLKFHKDLNLLVGKNGSGKTTALNILSSILSGDLTTIIKYQFEDLKIVYTDIDENLHNIIIKNKEQDIVIKLDDEEETIEKIEIKNQSVFDRNFSSINKNREFQGLSKLREAQPTYYLSLSRDMGNETSDLSNGNRLTNNLDESIQHIRDLVLKKHQQIMRKSEEYNREMRNEIFEAMFDYDSSRTNIKERIIKSREIKELRASLKEIGLNSESFDKFIESMNSDIRKLSAKELPEYDEQDIETQAIVISNVSQFLKIKKLWNIADKTNKRKVLENETITKFLGILNSFLIDSGKKIVFNPDKKIPLAFELLDPPQGATPYSLMKLSSGEKQLVIFFAYLLFKIEKNEQATFIIDEPELSLHLHWQRKFCKSALEISPNNQFIFATHSPEIIGSYRNKCRVIGDEN